MARNKTFPYVHDVHVNDKRGVFYYYFRKTGHLRVRLPAPYGGVEFRKAYDEAMMKHDAPIGASRTIPGSMNALIISFYASARFNDLRQTTRTVYRNIIEQLRAAYGHRSASGMEAHHVKALIDAKKAPHARKRLLKIISLLMAHAVDLGWRSDNPARDVKVKLPTSDGFTTWTEDQIEKMRAAYALGTLPRLVFELALNTGQRRGDLVSMGWRHLADGWITIRQSKTGTEAPIPVTPDLWRVLETCPRDRLTFIAATTGKPFAVASLGNMFRDWVKTAGLPDKLSLHGLRKAAGRRLAEAACTAHEIMAILGHKSLSEAQRYTATFARKAAAREAQAKVVQMFVKKGAQAR